MTKLRKAPNNIPTFKAENMPSDIVKALSLSPCSLYATAASKGGVHFGGWVPDRNELRSYTSYGFLSDDEVLEKDSLLKKIFEKVHDFPEFSNAFGRGPFMGVFQMVEVDVPDTDFTVRILESQSSTRQRSLLSEYVIPFTDDVRSIISRKSSTLNREFLKKAVEGLFPARAGYYCNDDESVAKDRLWIAVRSDDPSYVYLDRDTVLVAPSSTAENLSTWFLVKPRELGEWVLPLAAWTQCVPEDKNSNYSKILEYNLFADEKTVGKVRKLVVENFQVKEGERNIVSIGREAERIVKDMTERVRMQNAEFDRLRQFSLGKLQKIRMGGWKLSFDVPVKELSFELEKGERHEWEALNRDGIRIIMENPHTKLRFCPWSLTVENTPSNQLERLLLSLSRGYGEGFVSETLSKSIFNTFGRVEDTTGERIQSNIDDINLEINGVPVEIQAFANGGIKVFGKRIRKEDLTGILESCMCMDTREEMVSLAEDCSELSLSVRQTLTDGLRFEVNLPVITIGRDWTGSKINKARKLIRERYSELFELYMDNKTVLATSLPVEIPVERNTTGKNARLKIGIPLPGNRFMLVRLKFLKKVMNIVERTKNSYGLNPFNSLLELFQSEASRNGLENWNGVDTEVFRRAMLKGATFYKRAFRKSEELLREACEELETEKTTKRVEGKEVEGYSLVGNSGTEYFVSAERPYRIFQNTGNSWNFLCVVGNTRSEGVGKDELVTRLFALKNDVDSVDEVSTLPVPR